MKKSRYHLLIISLFASLFLLACQSEIPTSADDSSMLTKYGGGNGNGNCDGTGSKRGGRK